MKRDERQYLMTAPSAKLICLPMHTANNVSRDYGVAMPAPTLLARSAIRKPRRDYFFQSI